MVAGTGDTDNSAFTIDGDQLRINSSPDFETQSSYSILVQSTDPGGLSYSENLTININNVNEGPTDIDLSNNSIDENVAPNTVVGTFSTTDPDTGDTFTYQLVAGTGDTDNSAFTIDGDQLRINSSPDFETQSSYSILVQSTDPGGLSYSENLTININNVNEGPTDIDLSNNSIDEKLQLEVFKKIGSSRDDIGYGIATDNNGNVWATGDFRSSIDIDGDGNIDLINTSEEDSYIVKFDSKGDLVKAEKIGASFVDIGRGIATDSNGNAWATGFFIGPVSIDDAGVGIINSGSYIAKFDSDGNLVFVLDFGGSGQDIGRGIATDSNGNAWVTGEFRGGIDIDRDRDGTIDLTSNGSSDSYVVKFDRNGDLVFALNIGGSGQDIGRGIATDSNGNAWVTGDFIGSIDIDLDGKNDLTSNGSSDSYVAKFDPNGDLVFALNFGGSNQDSGRGIATDSNGNAWVTGDFIGSIDIDGDGKNDLTSNGSSDSYVAKFDPNGDLVFALNFGGSNQDIGRGIATDSNGNAWVTGDFIGSIDIDLDGKNDLTSNGSSDSYVAKFDPNGDLVFALNFGASFVDIGYGIATDSNGNAWATGSFGGSIDINGDGKNDLTSNGEKDSYVFKFSDTVAPNTVVGTFSTTDPDTGDTFTYQLVAGAGDTDNAAFTIDEDQLRINSSPDFETPSSYSILVQSTDLGGLSYSENFTININDVNETLGLMNRMAQSPPSMKYR
ncbi:MAG: SBBP repeat-containing protein [Hormoscilla sp. GM7CHS1pb]|nr:SBBP repeat-containing protein [Hormoscilla sp. GM7CHS1pb]